MNIDLTVAKQQVYDEVESWVKTAQAKLETDRRFREIGKGDRGRGEGKLKRGVALLAPNHLVLRVIAFVRLGVEEEVA